ncbi:hypothetical protein CHS0354_031193 [Potamilus streckersoni]|uniref:G-protein coupled receptors family 1 profile domain-containing protein n=1 Tax=Potamilus streckersoni TaxID=2493646 RepID=A0AAE0WEY5_9BIVA|nr:hypothetical protein CHS0354_031193 [Potamilus streckersoni]
MACTASILNLTAISVDRFIAVTQPIKYAKHKNSKRVYAMLVLTWVVSIAIAAPIALGVNYSPLRLPGDCSFFNSDFLIYSSMGSFYIPSLMMIFLYWRIYRVLRQRARQLAVKKRGRTVDTQTLTNVIENTATVQTMVVEKATVKTSLATMDNGKVSTYNTNETTESPDHADEHSTSNPPTNTDSQEKEDESDSKTPVKIEHGDHSKAELIINPVAHDMEARKIQTVEGVVTELGEMETNFSGASKSNQCKNNKAANNDTKTRKKEKKGVTKFNFHLRTSRKRKERSSSRREKKATKTLAIVLDMSTYKDQILSGTIY